MQAETVVSVVDHPRFPKTLKTQALYFSVEYKSYQNYNSTIYVYKTNQSCDNLSPQLQDYKVQSPM